MITPSECRIRARDARIEGFRIISDRERRYRGYWLGADPYPGWAREMDRRAGDRFAEATRYDRLAEGSFLARLFWRAEP